MVNLDGQVIGINTAISSSSGGSDGIGFAVPINLAKWVADQLIEKGSVQRAFLGIGIQPITQELADHFGVQPRQGLLITQVLPESPAAESGLRPGDVLVEFAGAKVSAGNELLEQAEVGQRYEHFRIVFQKHSSIARAVRFLVFQSRLGAEMANSKLS